jgi:branched-chain amino acid transport system substrate-binding protein
MASAQTTKPIKIGVVYALSGPTGLSGEGLILGTRVAVAEIMKAKGFLGRPVELFVRDDAGNPELTTRYCREFATRQEVDWILTGFGTGCGLAAAAVAKEFKIPTFIMGGLADRITVEDWNPYIFRFQPNCTSEARDAAEVLAEEVLKGTRNPRIYWIGWDYEYSRNLHEAFVPWIKKLKPGVQIIGEAWPRTGETDYGPFINHMLAVGPDVVVNSIWAGGAVSFLKQSSSMGLWNKSTLFSMADFASIEYRRIIGKDMPEGAWGNAFDDTNWPNSDGQRKIYQEVFNFTGKKDIFSSYITPTYYITHFVNEAMKKAKTSTGLPVIKAMEGLTINTYWGPFTVRNFDHNVTSGKFWAPMAKQEGATELVLDTKRLKYIYSTKNLPTEEEWLARRKGK